MKFTCESFKKYCSFLLIYFCIFKLLGQYLCTIDKSVVKVTIQARGESIIQCGIIVVCKARFVYVIKDTEGVE